VPTDKPLAQKEGGMREQFEEAVYVYAEAIHDNAIMGEQNVTGDELRAMANRVASAQLALMAKFDAALQAATLAERERCARFVETHWTVRVSDDLPDRSENFEVQSADVPQTSLKPLAAAIRSADEKEG